MQDSVLPSRPYVRQRRSERISDRPRSDYTRGSIFHPRPRGPFVPLEIPVPGPLGTPPAAGDRWLPHPPEVPLSPAPVLLAPYTPGAHCTPPDPGALWVSRSLPPIAPWGRPGPAHRIQCTPAWKVCEGSVAGPTRRGPAWADQLHERAFAGLALSHPQRV